MYFSKDVSSRIYLSISLSSHLTRAGHHSTLSIDEFIMYESESLQVSGRQIQRQVVMCWVNSCILNKSHSKLYKIMYFLGLHQGKLGMRDLIFYGSKGSATYNIAGISMWELFYSLISHRIKSHIIKSKIINTWQRVRHIILPQILTAIEVIDT